MLTFLSPVFLAGALAAAVPVVLHLLKREPEPRLKFAAVRLLKNAPVEQTQKHRLRELLLLALRVTTLVLLALAFARPFFASGSAASGGVTIVALDTSYSMSAPGRFDRARQLAKEAIARAPSGDLVGVVTFSDAGEIAAHASADRVLAAAAVDRAAPGYGATRYSSALSAATQALAPREGRRGAIVVVTDLQENGWDEGDRAAVPDGTRVDVVDAAAPAADVAVTAVRPTADRIVATIYNAGAAARDIKAHLVVDGRPAGDATASIGPGQSSDVAFAAAPRGRTAAVRLDDPEGIPADDVRYAVLNEASRPGVLLVTGGTGRDAFYVQHALAARDAGGRGYDVSAVSGGELSAPNRAADADSLSRYAAVLLLSTRGLERRGRESLADYVRQGGGLLIAAGPEVDGEVASNILGDQSSLRIVVPPERAQARSLAPVDVRHPIFRTFAATAATLSLVRFQNAAHVNGRACQTLARFSTGDEALIECGGGEGRVLVLASDLDNRWNDFPLHASFVPFLHETVGYLSSGSSHRSEFLVADAPGGVPREPGVYDATQPGRSGPRRVAVNVDPREAESARLTVQDFQSAVTHLAQSGESASHVEGRQQEDDQHLWQYALVLVVLTLAVEGSIASRTA